MMTNLCISESCKVKTLPIMWKNKQVELGFGEKCEGDNGTEWHSGFSKILYSLQKK